MTLDTHLQLVVEPLECPAMSEVVLRMPRAGGTTPSSAWVRGTELARVETRRRSGWSSLRLRRRWLRLGSLKLRPFSRLIRLWETTSSKRSRCFLGMKILANIVGSDTISDWQGKHWWKAEVKRQSRHPVQLFMCAVTEKTVSTFLHESNITNTEWLYWKSHETSISAPQKSKIIYPDLSNHPSSKLSKKNRVNLVLIMYCSSCRSHLIGSKIVQSTSSHGRAEAGRRDWLNNSLCAMWASACVWERMKVIRKELCLCGPVTEAAAGKSVQHQWQLTANMWKMEEAQSQSHLWEKAFNSSLLVLFSPPIINSQCIFLLKKTHPQILSDIRLWYSVCVKGWFCRHGVPTFLQSVLPLTCRWKGRVFWIGERAQYAITACSNSATNLPKKAYIPDAQAVCKNWYRCLFLTDSPCSTSAQN